MAASRAHTLKKQKKTLSQTKWKAKINPQGFLLVSTYVPTIVYIDVCKHTLPHTEEVKQEKLVFEI